MLFLKIPKVLSCDRLHGYLGPWTPVCKLVGNVVIQYQRPIEIKYL